MHRTAGLLLTGVALALGVLAACGGTDSGSSLIPGNACVPGQQVACACAGGGTGEQTCAANGQSFSSCTACSTAMADKSDGGSLGQVEIEDGGTVVLVSPDGAIMALPDDAGSRPPMGGQDATTPPHPSHDAGPVKGMDAGSVDATTPPPPPPVDAGPGVNASCGPAAFDFTGNGCGVGNVSCDTGLTIDGPATDFARAIGLCAASADAEHWGVVSASYTNGHTSTAAGADNFNQQHGILGMFGGVLVPREGVALGVLSSGSATVFDSDNGPFFKGSKNGMQGASTSGTSNSGDVPAGFPAAAYGCPQPGPTVNDVIDVKLSIRVPINAHGFAFDFNFMSGDWPDYACSTFNDGFVAYVTSAAIDSGSPINIATDTSGSPISINSPSLQACTPGTVLGCAGNPLIGTGLTGDGGTSLCPAGPTSLNGTGYEMDGDAGAYCGGIASTSGGGTNWLTTTAPAKPGELLSVEFIIWDSGDASYDSSVLLDHFRWIPSAVGTPFTTLAK